MRFVTLSNINLRNQLQKKRSRILLAMFSVLVMLGILTILNLTDRALSDAERERGISEAKEKILLDLKLLQKASSPEVHFGSYFFQALAAKNAEIGNGKNWQHELNGFLEKKTKSFRINPEWYLFDFRGIQDPSGVFNGEELWHSLLGGKTPSYSPEVVRLLCLKGILGFSRREMDSSSKHFMNEIFNSSLGERTLGNQTSFARSSMGCFQEVSIQKKRHYFAWFPLFEKSWSSALTRFDKVDLRQFDPRNLSFVHLKGVAAIVFDEKEFLEARRTFLLRALKQNFKTNKCQLTFERCSTILASQSGFLPNQTMHLANDGDLVATTRLTLGETYLVKAHRKTRLSNASDSGFEKMGFIMKLIWVVSGIVFIGNFFLMRRKVSLKLGVQLIIFMCWILFPAFYLGYNATERYILEKQTASMSYLRGGLEELVSAFDGSTELYKTWVCDTISGVIDRSFKAHEIDLSSMSEHDSRNVLDDVRKELLKNGIFSKNIFLVVGGGETFSAMHGADSKEESFFQNFFKAFYLPVIKENSRGEGKNAGRRSQLLMDAHAEELVNIARSVLSAKALSSLAIKPLSLDKLEGFGDQAYIFHKYLGRGVNAEAVIQIGLGLPSIERSSMIDWIENFSQKKFENLVWVITRNNHPTWFLRAPFWKAVKTGKMGLLSPVFDFLPADLLFWSLIGTKSKEPFTTIIDFAGEKCLLASLPGKSLLDYKIGALIPLRNHYESLAKFRRMLLLSMTAILILCSLIGFRLASGFIRPVKNLAANAEKLMAGDLSVRLPEIWEDSEISALSRNFNEVAANVETGKVLRKFVSDGALEIIQLGESLSSERNLKPISAIVLFLRLDKFWENTSKLPPENVVFELNRFFGMICREVNEAGGDVNKFIGEKVMAIFELKDEDTFDAQAFAAAKFALRISDLTQGNDGVFSNCPIRIGVAAGRVLSGVIGSEKNRLEQTVIGDVVNLASRLCTFDTGEKILVNSKFAALLDESYAGLPFGEIVRLADQEIKGKKEAVRIFALRGT